jgi:hypothetical protein
LLLLIELFNVHITIYYVFHLYYELDSRMSYLFVDILNFREPVFQLIVRETLHIADCLCLLNNLYI